MICATDSAAGAEWSRSPVKIRVGTEDTASSLQWGEMAIASANFALCGGALPASICR